MPFPTLIFSHHTLFCNMFEKSKLLSVILLSLASTLVCGKGDPSQGEVAATVNDSEIYELEVADKMKPILDHLKKKYSGKVDGKLLKRIRDKALGTLIDRKVLLTSDKAEALKISDEAVEKHIDELVKKEGLGSLPRYKAYVASRNISWEAWKKKIKEGMVISSIREQFAKDVPPPREHELKKLYSKQKERFSSGGRVKISLIVLDPDNAPNRSKVKDYAIGVQHALFDTGPTAWGECVSKFSVGPNAKKGGQWDWCSISEFPLGFAKTLKGMQPGEIHKIGHGDYFYFLRFDEIEKEKQLSFAEAKEQLKDAVIQEKAAEAWETWSEKEKKKARIKLR